MSHDKQREAPPLDPARVRFSEELAGGGMWSRVLRRHQTLRLVDLEGRANVGLLLYNADLPSERYNMPDTLKAQHTAFVSLGRVLFSDMGRVLCSMMEDSLGWHDTLCGHLDRAGSEARFGKEHFQERRNDFPRNARDSFLIELGKWGLGKRDLVPNVNLFSKVTVDETGGLHHHPGHSRVGATVDLRAEMNVLVVLNSCPHPLDTAPRYAPGPVRLVVWQAEAPGPDDPCRLLRPESARGMENSERLFL